MSGKTLVIGGMHGNEPLGPAIVGLLKTKPLPGIDRLIANPRATRASVRFVEEDLNRVFPGMRSGSYERRRAQIVLGKARQYDLVLDFHNTLANQPSCGFVGSSYDTNLLKVASVLGIGRVIEATYDCINKYVPNCLSVEVCVQDSNPEAWYSKLRRVGSASAVLPVRYRFLERVTWEQSRQLQTSAWLPFAEIPVQDKLRLGINGSACPIFIGSTLTPYFATLVEEIIVPSGTIETKED